MGGLRSGQIVKHLILITFTVMALFPIYIMLTASLKTNADFLHSPLSLLGSNPSFDAFRSVLNDQFLIWIRNSILLTGVAVPVAVAIAAIAAWGLAYWEYRGRDLLLAAIVSLMVVPPAVLLVPLFNLGSFAGLVSTYQWVIFIYVGFMLPLSIFILTGFFRVIPRSLLEAAEIDGASSIRCFLSIVLPLARAPLVTIVVLNFLFAWNELLFALVFLQDPGEKTLMIGLTGLQGRYSMNVPVIMAGLTLAMLPTVLLYLVGQRYFQRGLVAGATKG